MTPVGFMRMAEIAPGALMHSFAHARVLKSPVETSKFVFANRGTNARPIAVSGTTIHDGPRWRIRPGAVRSAGQSITAGTSRSTGTYGEKRSTCSTPFCNTTTGVFLPQTLGIHRAALAA